jgi:hypothetical protein
MRDTARMSSSSEVARVRARCVGGPAHGDLLDLEITPADPKAVAPIRALGGSALAERYRLVDERTTTGEPILVYVGEPREP